MKQKLVMVTAYDYPGAKIIDEVGVDYILVGDSLAMTILGHQDTKSITMEEMLHHVKAVIKGAQSSKIIADMPINSYTTATLALKNAKRFMDVGAHFVKIEGAKFQIVKKLIANNIPVVGHLGLLPQTAKKYSVHGREEEEAQQILSAAKKLDSLGIEALVLECVPTDLAKKISNTIDTPTIGIGAGVDCDGQVLVLADLIGLSDFKGKMVKQYADVKSIIEEALTKFKTEVVTKKFPGKENTFV